MREIKFRAWDLDKLRMVYVINMEYDYNRDLHHAVITNSPMEVGERRHNCDDLVFMQFTGFKDKNGKEIYEGDIVATGNDGNDGADVWKKEDNGYAQVMFNDGWGVDIISKHYGWSYNDAESIYALKYLEIIGNIYENPELLQEDKLKE